MQLLARSTHRRPSPWRLAGPPEWSLQQHLYWCWCLACPQRRAMGLLVSPKLTRALTWLSEERGEEEVVLWVFTESAQSWLFCYVLRKSPEGGLLLERVQLNIQSILCSRFVAAADMIYLPCLGFGSRSLCACHVW